jgi:CHAT domain-containing protein/tetratricopeptide (TPR) repeat protein
MLRFQACLCLGLMCFIWTHGSLGCDKVSQRVQIDSTEVIALIYRGKIKAVVSYLESSLANPGLSKPDRCRNLLTLAIFYSWSEEFAKGAAAFGDYLAQGAGIPPSRNEKPDVLLFHSLQLAGEELFNQASDSLIASVAARPKNDLFNQLLLADSYGQLARFYKRTGDHFEAARNFERSVSMNRKLGRAAKLAEDLADMSSELSVMDPLNPQADSALLESLAIYSSTGSRLELAQVYHEFGILLNRRGRIRESLTNFQKSLAVKNSIRNLGDQEFIVVMNSIGTSYQAMGNSDSARLFFSRAIDYALKADKSPAAYYANLGANFGLTEDYTKALVYFQKAINSADKTCSASDISANPAITHVTPKLAEYTAFKGHTFHRRYHQTKDPADLVNGIDAFMVALEMIDTLRFTYSFESKPYLSSSAKIHFFNALDMALDLFKLTGKKTYLDQAFELSERNKSATLNEFLRTNQARGFMHNKAPWIHQEDSIKMLIDRIQSRLINLSSATGERTADKVPFEERLTDLGNELKSINTRAKRENPEYFNIVYSSKGYKPQEIQDLIRSGEAIIDYTVVHDSRLSLDYMVTLVTTHDTLYSFRDTLPAKFREDIRKFRSTITSFVDAKVFRDFTRLSYLMFRTFFEPIEKFKNISKLIILPDEELGFLPFEVFISDTVMPKGSDFSRLNYLNRRYQISYISSHEQFFQFRKNPNHSMVSRVYAFAPFARQAARMDTVDLLPLGNSENEAMAISTYFRTTIFEGKEAGEQTLRSVFGQKSVISLSTHGIMSLQRPMESRLLLNPSEPDGSLYLFEMLSLKINSPLVILNACNTGMGELQVGEGIMSMARGFQYAGVPSVITTLWPIDDQSSATVMGYFFMNISKGMEQGEALMQARNKYIDEASKATAAPYFWAGQVLIGDPGRLIIRARPLRVIWITVIAVAIVLAALYLYFKKRRRGGQHLNLIKKRITLRTKIKSNKFSHQFTSN